MSARDMRRLPYDEAIWYRPEGVCGCNFNDRECYARGHWEAR